jgi:hypothetical protein
MTHLRKSGPFSLHPRQGDRMSLGKSHRKFSPNNVFVKINSQLLPVKKVAPKFWATFVIFKLTGQRKHINQ